MTTRRLTAMERDEEGTLSRIKTLQREVIEPRVNQRGGRLVKTTGDGFLCEFGSPVEAVRCALEVQEATKANGGSDLRLRMGINLGDIIVEPDGDIYGDGVNVAARLEKLAEPGGISISGPVHDQIEGKVPVTFESRGEQQVKNIARPVRVYVPAGSAPNVGEPKPLPLPDKPSIAVLPFTNLSGDPEQEYFADGVVEDIIAALSRVKWFFVIARNSSFTYKGKAVDVRQVGRELGVRYVLEGSIRKSVNRVRIGAQLIAADTQRHVWADRLDGELADIFDLQDRVTEAIASAMEPSLQAAEIQRAKAKPTQSLDAYDLYLRALAEMTDLDRDHYRRAEQYLRRAIAQDSGFSEAWALLADCVSRATIFGWIEDFQAGCTEARSAALKAIRADPANGVALATAAYMEAVLGGSHEKALDLAERALAIHPNSETVQRKCGWAFSHSGQSDRAIQHLETARRLSPTDPHRYFIEQGMVTAHFFARRYEECIARAQRVLAGTPSNTGARRFLAAALAHSGRGEEARRAVTELLERQPNASLTRSRKQAFGHPWMSELYIDGLREAGLPE